MTPTQGRFLLFFFYLGVAIEVIVLAWMLATVTGFGIYVLPLPVFWGLFASVLGVLPKPRSQFALFALRVNGTLVAALAAFVLWKLAHDQWRIAKGRAKNAAWEEQRKLRQELRALLDAKRAPEAKRYLQTHPALHLKRTDGESFFPEVLCPKDHTPPDPELLRLLAERGDHRDGELLYQAARCSLDAAKVVLGMGVPVGAVSSKGRTALMGTADLETAAFFVEHGVKVDARDREGRTALMFHRTPQITKYLLDHGANPKAVDKEGYSVLHFAGAPPLALHKECFAQLIAAGADPKAKAGAGRWTTLTTMVEQERWDQDTADLLVEHGAESSPDILERLIQHDIDIAASLKWPGLDLAGAGGARLLIAAIASRSESLVQQLLDAGANPTATTESGRVPLKYYEGTFGPSEPPTGIYKALLEAAARHRPDDAGT